MALFQVYDHAHAEAFRSLGLGRSVVTDGSYLNPCRREHLLGRCLAADVNAGIVLLDDGNGARARNRLREGDAQLPDAEPDAAHVAQVRAARRDIELEPWATWLVFERVGAAWRVHGYDHWGLAPLVLQALSSP